MSGLETERKFLVRSDSFRHQAHSHSHITQGYLSSATGRTVRVRRRDDRAYLTIKGPSTADGLTRYEFEHEISLDEARHLFELCEPGIVDKTRWLVSHEGHTFEVDEFHGPLEGLVVAEVELSDAAEMVIFPDFIGKEVTGDRRYYNSVLRAGQKPED